MSHILLQAQCLYYFPSCARGRTVEVVDAMSSEQQPTKPAILRKVSDTTTSELTVSSVNDGDAFSHSPSISHAGLEANAGKENQK